MAAADYFRAFADCLREPAILVSTTGELAALNAAAATLLGVDPAPARSISLSAFVEGGAETLVDFLHASARTRQPIFASLLLRGASGERHEYRAEGVQYRPAGSSEPPAVFIRLTRPELSAVTTVEPSDATAEQRSGATQLVGVNDLVTSAAALLRPLLGESIALVTRLAARAPLVRVDQTEIERVLVNLGVHARDQMDPGGRLTIETGGGKQVATIVLADSGPTPTPAALARLFAPWSSGDADMRSGISLASSRATIEALGGSITATSGGSAGTVFTIRLPAASAGAEGAAPAAPSVTVLVVDDDDTARDLIAESLRSADFRVLCASDGLAAVELARAHPERIDLLVTDVVMPKMNGPRVVQILREQYPRLRVLYVSGYTNGIDLPMNTPGPPSAFLAKPFTRGTLLGRVHTLLGK